MPSRFGWVPMGISSKVKNAHDLVLFRHKARYQSRIIQPFVFVVFGIVVKGVIDIKPVYKEENSFHRHGQKIKNPGPLGHPGALRHGVSEGGYNFNIENLTFFVNSFFQHIHLIETIVVLAYSF